MSRDELRDFVERVARGEVRHPVPEARRILGIPADLDLAPERVAEMRAAAQKVAAEREQREALKDATTSLKNATPAMALAASNENGAIGGLQGAA